MALTIEECYVRKIECGIRSIKLGNKKPEDVQLRKAFDKLRTVNDGLCDDLLTKYDNVMKAYQKKIENTYKKVW